MKSDQSGQIVTNFSFWKKKQWWHFKKILFCRWLFCQIRRTFCSGWHPTSAIEPFFLPIQHCHPASLTNWLRSILSWSAATIRIHKYRLMKMWPSIKYFGYISMKMFSLAKFKCELVIDPFLFSTILWNISIV